MEVKTVKMLIGDFKEQVISGCALLCLSTLFLVMSVRLINNEAASVIECMVVVCFTATLFGLMGYFFASAFLHFKAIPENYREIIYPATQEEPQGS